MSLLDRSGPLRRVLFQVHLWVGVVAALYVLVVSVTGAALVFRIHLQRAVHPELLTARTDGPQADIATVLERVRDAYPRGRLSGVDAPTTVRPTHLAYVTEDGRFRTVLSDPVTAEVLGELPEHSVVRTLQDLWAYAICGRSTSISTPARGSPRRHRMLPPSATPWWPGSVRCTSETSQDLASARCGSPPVSHPACWRRPASPCGGRA